MRFHQVNLALAVLAIATAVAQCGEIGAAAHRWARVRKLWQHYKAKYSWSYPSLEEETYRFELFSEQLQHVEEHNARNLSWTQSINQLSVLSKGELASLAGDRFVRDSALRTPQELGILDENDTGELAANLSWLDVANTVGRVKSQGQCGSCWAFATIALIESRQRLTGDNFTSLSEQQLVDCVEPDEGNNFGCHGYQVSRAVDYVIRSGGLEAEHNYPYTSGKGQTGACRFNESLVEPFTRKIEAFSHLNCSSEEELKRVLVRYGPVTVSISGDFSGLYGYEKGVFSREGDPKVKDRHAVLLVGYGADERNGEYWILKNSWGADWGMGGFFWMARNRNLMRILSKPSVVL